MQHSACLLSRKWCLSTQWRGRNGWEAEERANAENAVAELWGLLPGLAMVGEKNERRRRDLVKDKGYGLLRSFQTSSTTAAVWRNLVHLVIHSQGELKLHTPCSWAVSETSRKINPRKTKLELSCRRPVCKAPLKTLPSPLPTPHPKSFLASWRLNALFLPRIIFIFTERCPYLSVKVPSDPHFPVPTPHSERWSWQAWLLSTGQKSLVHKKGTPGLS